jgi:hypothetical protein
MKTQTKNKEYKILAKLRKEAESLEKQNHESAKEAKKAYLNYKRMVENK